MQLQSKNIALIMEYRLSSKTLWDEIYNDYEYSGGAYKLYSRKNGDVQPIKRFLSIDKEGTIYIGKASRFIYRIIALKKTLDPNYKSNPHIAGRRYHLNRKIHDIYPYDSLHVFLLSDPNPLEKEKELLGEYFQDFGEVPPLNAI